MGNRNTEGIPLVCYYADCGYSWRYNGGMVHYATCPRCLRKLKISKAHKEGED